MKHLTGHDSISRVFPGWKTDTDHPYLAAWTAVSVTAGMLFYALAAEVRRFKIDTLEMKLASDAHRIEELTHQLNSTEQELEEAYANQAIRNVLEIAADVRDTERPRHPDGVTNTNKPHRLNDNFLRGVWGDGR